MADLDPKLTIPPSSGGIQFDADIPMHLVSKDDWNEGQIFITVDRVEVRDAETHQTLGAINLLPKGGILIEDHRNGEEWLVKAMDIWVAYVLMRLALTEEQVAEPKREADDAS